MPEVPCIEQALRWARQQLQELDDAAIDARLLLGHCVEKPVVYLHTWPDRPLDEQQWQQFKELISKRKKGVPVAHLVGYRDFWTLRLQVSDKTLIPRPETELLVETALEKLPETKARILDLGTGTGAIALSLASERQDCHVTGLDFDPDIVALAAQNARLNGLNNLTFLVSDWFSALQARSFDLIVSNPPYVEPDSPWLDQGDVRYEPQSALVAEHNGLADLEKIICLAPQYLVDKGWLLLEHGYQQSRAVQDKLIQRGFCHVTTLRDLAGLDRVSLGQYVVG
ncbi:peptide chain release factor N(5)-glutamine methyltransferase [Bowmanella dokdonensis]|uniref:Release factor glutamine methyltransferase n=1 Tax=Bowmanella dokdonensis TaxID=751969 RepID=A0A939DNE8_9ALTE|nr:peptide chain release factor N(5)-glutamine methyltransferase [Bowmanella dokdonensis]MBN7824991.1 peptide chain release factor N(5)-glutamine methyltransferase [Bowmanella dokdonensis]